MTTTSQPADADSALHDLRVAIGRLGRRTREESASADLSWPQATVLARLDREGPATTSALARAEGMRPQSMGAIVSALEERGYVQRSPDENDGRQSVLTVTPAGHERLEQQRAARQDWLTHAVTSQLTPDEQEQLLRAVPLLVRVAQG